MGILELKQGDLFKLRDKEDYVFMFMRVTTDRDKKVTNTVIRPVAFKMDGEWHFYSMPVHTENCNWCANVTKVAQKIDFVEIS